jgi:hypothetical protein
MEACLGIVISGKWVEAVKNFQGADFMSMSSPIDSGKKPMPVQEKTYSVMKEPSSIGEELDTNGLNLLKVNCQSPLTKRTSF